MASRAIEIARGPRRSGLATQCAVAALLAVAVIATRAIWFGDPVADPDEQLYSLIGQQLLHGQLPYIDLWDRKSFGLYALYALAHWMLGPGPIAYQIFAAAFTFVGAMLTYGLARDVADRFGATAAGVLYTIWMAAYASYSGQSEAFHVPLMVGMVWLVRNPDHPDAPRRALWAMVLGGLAMQIKITVLPQCVMLGGWVLYSRWRRGLDWAGILRLGAIYGLIGTAPTMIVATFYASIGGLGAFIQATITSSFERATGPLGRFSSSDAVWANPLMILTALGVYGAFRVKRPDDMTRYCFYVAWLLSCLATVFLPSTVYLYYFAAAVPAAVLLVTPLIDRRGPFGPFSALILVALGFLILQIPDRYRMARKEKAQTTQLAEAIAPHVSHSDCLWVYDGPTALYRMSGSCLPTRFIYPDHLNNLLEHDALGTSQPGEVRRILSHEPPVIVAASKPWTVQSPDVAAIVQGELARDYRPIASATLNERVITAYLRR